MIDYEDSKKLANFSHKEVKAQHKVEDWMLSDESIREYLAKRSTDNLRKDLIKNCHPFGKPDDSWEGFESLRWFYIDELHNRGKKAFEDLGWDTSPNAEYINIHTGSTHKFIDLLNKWGSEEERMALRGEGKWDETPFILESNVMKDDNQKNIFLICQGQTRLF